MVEAGLRHKHEKDKKRAQASTRHSAPIRFDEKDFHGMDQDQVFSHIKKKYG